ncbi:hypothetical protein GWK47_014146 [Chionoecetes opilio]|uniref:Uncharacterized protein n=1 Tax=Chionoecetes opilio TaxID=41210 RepID=A0A8J5CKM1_CHIOP|nr:hypothetical protein GWK47_014146 [Chionoecetes opilio]
MNLRGRASRSERSSPVSSSSSNSGSGVGGGSSSSGVRGGSSSSGGGGTDSHFPTHHCRSPLALASTCSVSSNGALKAPLKTPRGQRQNKRSNSDLEEQNENVLYSPAQYNSAVNASLAHCPAAYLRASRYANKFPNCKSSHQAPVIDSDNNIIESKLLKPRPLRISRRQNQPPPNYKCHPPRKPHSKRHHIANGSQATKVLCHEGLNMYLCINTGKKGTDLSLLKS